MKILVGTLCLLLVATTLGVWPVATVDGADPADTEIRAALERWTKAFETRDPVAACALFAPDLVATYPRVPDRDYGAMCRQLTTVLTDRARSFRYSFQIEEVFVVGELAVVSLTWTLRVTGPGDVTETIRERAVDIFRRQADGAWKISRSMAYEE